MLEIVNKCRLNDKQNLLLNEILTDLEDNHISGFNLSNFKGIRIADDNYLPSFSDGRLENQQVLLPYEKLINALANAYTDEYKKLRTTIYHELVHLDLENKYPQLHNLYKKLVAQENYVKATPIQIWMEYNAQETSEKLSVGSAIKIYFDSVCDFTWNLNDANDLVLLEKHLPYIIARINGQHLNREESLSRIKNGEVRKIILDVEEILKRLFALPGEDRIEYLKELFYYIELIESKYQ